MSAASAERTGALPSTWTGEVLLARLRQAYAGWADYGMNPPLWAQQAVSDMEAICPYVDVDQAQLARAVVLARRCRRLQIEAEEAQRGGSHDAAAPLLQQAASAAADLDRHLRTIPERRR